MEVEGSRGRPIGGQRAGGSDAFQHVFVFGGRLSRLFRQRRERGDVLAELVASPLVAPPIFCADESLRRALAFGHVGHVQTVPFEHLVQMLATILTHAETMHLFHRIKGERL